MPDPQVPAHTPPSSVTSRATASLDGRPEASPWTRQPDGARCATPMGHPSRSLGTTAAQRSPSGPVARSWKVEAGGSPESGRGGPPRERSPAVVPTQDSSPPPAIARGGASRLSTADQRPTPRRS